MTRAGLCLLICTACRLHFDGIAEVDARGGSNVDALADAPSCAAMPVPENGQISGTLTTSAGGDRMGSCGGQGVDELVWSIDVTIPGSGLLLAADGPALIDTLIYARASCNDVTTEVVCNNNDGVGDAAAIRLTSVAVGRYYIAVDGDMTNGQIYTGVFDGSINVLLPNNAPCDPAVPRDRCAPDYICQTNVCVPATCTATTNLSGSMMYTQTGSTLGGTNEHAGTCGQGSDGGTRAPEAVYSLTLAAGVSNVHVTTDNPGTSYDTLIYMRSGGCAGPEIGCDDDTFTTAVNASTIDTGALASGTYFIFVDGFASKSGNYELTVTITP
ncbi:MAG TPA: hypothetical protein VL326_26385 [Kofleriaceae bacterium]|nr:hypothetical protein [Kofleriaceae bacterium]